MAFKLMLLAHCSQHGHRDQAAGFQIQPWTLPHVTPSILSDVVLHGQGERRRIAERIGNKIFTHDLLAGGQTRIEVSVLFVFPIR